MVAAWAAQMASMAAAAAAQAPLLPDLNVKLYPSDATPWTILFVLTLITLLPAILMAMTPLARLLVVFHFLRQALGTQTAPSNPTLMGLALMMAWFLMAPVLNQVDRQAVEPRQLARDAGHGDPAATAGPARHLVYGKRSLGGHVFDSGAAQDRVSCRGGGAVRGRMAAGGAGSGS